MTHLNKQLRAVSICKYIFSEELLISGIILQACKCCHSSPSLFCIGISHSHCKRLEMLNTATFLSVNMNMYSFFCICPLCLPLSAPSLSPLSVCPTSQFLPFLFHLPRHCYLSLSFVRVYICTYQHILYRTSRYDIRPSVNTHIFSSFVSGWERLNR